MLTLILWSFLSGLWRRTANCNLPHLKSANWRGKKWQAETKVSSVLGYLLETCHFWSGKWAFDLTSREVDPSMPLSLRRVMRAGFLGAQKHLPVWEIHKIHWQCLSQFSRSSRCQAWVAGPGFIAKLMLVEIGELRRPLPFHYSYSRKLCTLVILRIVISS